MDQSLKKKKGKKYISKEEYDQYIEKRNKRNLIKRFYSKYRISQNKNSNIHSREYKSTVYEQLLESITEINNNYLKAQEENKIIRKKYSNSLRTNLELDQWHQK